MRFGLLSHYYYSCANLAYKFISASFVTMLLNTNFWFCSMWSKRVWKKSSIALLHSQAFIFSPQLFLLPSKCYWRPQQRFLCYPKKILIALSIIDFMPSFDLVLIWLIGVSIASMEEDFNFSGVLFSELQFLLFSAPLPRMNCAEPEHEKNFRIKPKKRNITCLMWDAPCSCRSWTSRSVLAQDRCGILKNSLGL